MWSDTSRPLLAMPNQASLGLWSASVPSAGSDEPTSTLWSPPTVPTPPPTTLVPAGQLTFAASDLPAGTLTDLLL